MNLPSCQHQKSIYSQEDVQKIKSAKIMCFLDSQWPELNQNLTNFVKFLYMVQARSQKSLGRCLKTRTFRIFSLKPNLDESSCGSWPLRLQHKIDKIKNIRAPIYAHIILYISIQHIVWVTYGRSGPTKIGSTISEGDYDL